MRLSVGMQVVEHSTGETYQVVMFDAVEVAVRRLERDRVPIAEINKPPRKVGRKLFEVKFISVKYLDEFKG